MQNVLQSRLDLSLCSSLDPVAPLSTSASSMIRQLKLGTELFAAVSGSDNLTRITVLEATASFQAKVRQATLS